MSWIQLSILVLTLGVGLAGCSTETASSPVDAPSKVVTAPANPANLPATGIVTVKVVGNESEQAFTVSDVANGDTVESVMRKIQGLDVVITGSGTTAFVHQIGDQSTDSDQGWTYTIDGERAERGIGATKVNPSATIRWSYGGYQE